MKGAIVKCLEDLVRNKFGTAKWSAILVDAGLSPGTMYSLLQDVDDAETLRLLQSACRVLNISLEQASDAFGEHWVTVYAPRTYCYFFETAKTAADFLLSLDGVHSTVTSMMKNARPPRFSYEWDDPKTLRMIYKSDRNLAILVVGLARGAGKYYKEKLEVSLVDPKTVKVTFEKARA